MPLSALEYVVVDARCSAAELGPTLADLAGRLVTVGGTLPVSEELHIENRIAMEDNPLALGITKLGAPSLYTCPDCNGVLLQLHGDGPLRFRCHTGHAFTTDTLVAQASEMLEERLWSVVRSMDENQLLLRQVAGQLDAVGNVATAARLREQARVVEQQTRTIRQVAFDQAGSETTGPPHTRRSEER